MSSKDKVSFCFKRIETRGSWLKLYREKYTAVVMGRAGAINTGLKKLVKEIGTIKKTAAGIPTRKASGA